MKEKRVKYVRFPVLLAVVLVMLFSCAGYLIVNGGSYTAELTGIQYDYPGNAALSVISRDENILAADRVYFNDKHLICADVHSVNPGDTEVIIDVRGGEGTKGENSQTIRIPFHVNVIGTVFQSDTLNFNGYLTIQYIILGSIFLVLLVTGCTFIESFFKARFSYSTVACGGVALFLLFVLAISLYDLHWINTFRNFLWNLSDSGFYFALYTTPFMLILAGAIAFSNIRLMRHEGRRPQNMLGIGLALAWVLGIAAIFWLLSAFDISGMLMTRIAYGIGYVLTFMECLLLSTIVSAFLSTKYKPPFDKDYLIILGCGIRSDGTLTPILRGRVDAAVRFERDQYAATKKHAKFVPSGGQGPDEVISESEAMKRYLMEQGYPADQIIMEDKSVNTDQNIRFSRERIKEDAGSLDGKRAGFATTNYHIFRGYILSKKHGLDAQGISAKTKWYFYPNAFLREFVGLLFEKKWFIVLTVLLILAFYSLGLYLLYITKV